MEYISLSTLKKKITEGLVSSSKPSVIFKFDTLNFDNKYFEKRVVYDYAISNRRQSETEIQIVLYIAYELFNTYKY